MQKNIRGGMRHLDSHCIILVGWSHSLSASQFLRTMQIVAIAVQAR